MPADPDNENGFSNTSRYCNSLGSQHDISAAADADSMPVKLHQNVSIRLNAWLGFLNYAPSPSPGSPSLLAASPAPPDLSPRWPGWLPVMGGAQRSQRSTSRSGSKGGGGARFNTTLFAPRAPAPTRGHVRWRRLGLMAATAASPRVRGQPAPADPQQERLKNRVIAAFQMQQLVEELAQREQAARCRRPVPRPRRPPLGHGRRPRGAAGRGSAACEGLIGTLQAATAALSPRPHIPDAAVAQPCIHPRRSTVDAEPHLQCWSGKVRLSLRDI
ncbi:hypothetical protein PAPYR_11550 [Paratrimastix pyriformis]|uniref:Uncharacterized protein n=1 Tax=Paratrimastix pyriformis TaxID=342808 RepID=A0ABQ8U584_9EUKA|nr:hypothetical protein PAPYR_11550 [Paratrimastix pyriformis]